jgi:hypothetical protein
VTLRTFTVSVQGPPSGGFTPVSGSFGLSGTVGDGQSVTITDLQSRFGTKPNGAKPYGYWDFGKNGYATTDPLSRNVLHAPETGALATDVKLSRSAAFWKFPIDSNTDAAYESVGVATDLQPAYPYLYVYYKIRTNWDGLEAYAALTSYNLKGFRFWYASGANNMIFASVGQSNSAPGNPRITWELTEAAAEFGNSHCSPISPKNVWRTQECFAKQSSGVDVADGQAWMTNDGQASVKYLNKKTRTAAWPNTYRYLHWHQNQFCGFAVSAGKFLGYDLVYVDDSWCRVMVTASSAWSEVSQAAEIQVPTAWADAGNSITFTLRQGEFASLSGKYLYVVKSDNTALKIGQFT